MPKIFISYRREDSIGIACRIYDRLGTHFGRDSVFMDLDAIPFGVDFRQHLSDAVSACDVLLAVIGDQWLTVSQNGQPRLQDARDFVRIEIEAALRRGIPVIPVLLGKTSMPREEELPTTLADLSYRNAAPVDPGRDFHTHVDRLIRGLEHLAGKTSVMTAESPPARPTHGAGEIVTNRLGMKFAWVPPGASWLGGGGGKPGNTPFTLEQGQWCGIYPVTQAEWLQVVGINPSNFSGNPRYPVEKVSWNDVQKFLDKLNARGRDYSYCLPTEQEWEYICRGGPITQDQSKYHFYFAKSKANLTPSQSDDLSNKANFGNHLQKPCNIGSYLPNPLGIYDMHGNVWEWTDSSEGSHRVVRGGSWSTGAEDCAASSRLWREPDGSNRSLGFRLLAVPRDRE